MKIQRKRYVVMRNNRTEIWGGCARNFHFRPITEIGDFSIKTYMSKSKAESSVSYWYDDFEIVPIVETFESVEE